jgi:DNA mismatch repair protein MutS2
MIDLHTLTVLEFARVQEETAEYCLSPQGAEHLGAQAVCTEAAEIDAILDRVGPLRTALESGPSMPSLDFPGIAPFLANLAKPGSVLEGEEVAAIGRYILSSLKLKRLLSKASQHPLVLELTDPIPDLSGVSQRIFRTVDPEGTLKERQIPSLVDIRGRIRRIAADLERTARSVLEDPATRTY